MKFWILFMFIAVSASVNAQLDLVPDTVLFTERTGGIQDTFDIAGNPLPSSFDGGRTLSTQAALAADQLFSDITNYRLNTLTRQDPMRYSSLPHLGFAYSFGSQGTQFLHLRYTQAFLYGFKLNLDYDRMTGAGLLRNSDFSSDNVRLRLQRDGLRYSVKLSGSFQSYKISHPGGVTTDSTINVDTLLGIGLEFVPVQKSANSETRMATAELQNFVNFTSDSLNHLGLVTKHRFEIINRKYFETNTQLGTNIEGYSMLNYDSLQTQDVWNHPSIKNGAGVYFLNKNTGFYIDGTIDHRYWNSWDVRDLRDTTEIDLSSELRFEWKRVSLKNSFRFNLIGGFNGWENRASAQYSSKKLQINGHAIFSSLPAEALQRFYYGNNYYYELNTINRQVWFKVGGNARFTIKDSLLALEGGATSFSLPSVYTFDGSSWNLNDSLGSTSSLRVGAHFQWNFFHWRPAVVVSTDRYNYLPTFQGYSRLYLKGRLFKAKKLAAIIGFDGSFNNGFSLRSYIPSMDAFTWDNGVGMNPGVANLHFFASLGIDQFRFYARFENIGYFWNDRTIYEADGYPIAGTRIRVGISWDFFN
ncbi:MAG: putative porin [Fluviicola sp.]